MATRPASPAEPTRKHSLPIQPNAHPYAIKTTSTALLSRSTCSPHTTHHTKHHYVPSSSSPSRIPTGTRMRHRHSSSLSSADGEGQDRVPAVPAPLPSPPSLASPSDSPSLSLNPIDDSRLTYQAQDGDTPLSVSSATDMVEQRNHENDQGSRPEPYAGLPHNPRKWNADQLTTYLETSLKSDNGFIRGEDDSGHVEILEYVRKCGFTGRELLRLTNEDLSDTPLSDLQRAQLLERSRTLRTHVLRGRIYADSYHSHGVFRHSDDVYSQSSVSAEDLRLLPDKDTSEGEDILPPSPAVSFHRSNSLSDASAQRYKDLARMRMRRRGRVKGLVETWERASTSESEYSASERGEGTMSGSEVESETGTSPSFKSISDAKQSPESPSEIRSALHDEKTHDSPEVHQAQPLSTPPPPYTHTYTSLGVVEDEEEPSIEELLASSSSNIPLRGARAWEADFGLGDTVKRIPTSANADASTIPLITDQGADNAGKQSRGNSVQSKRSSIRGSTGGAEKNAKTRKRVVTAIFAGSPSDNVSNTSNENNAVDHVHRASGVVNDGTPARTELYDESDGPIRALEESIAATRAQMDAFRLRLEKVEADTAKLEAGFERRQAPDNHSPAEFKKGLRRSEANEQAMAETGASSEVVEGLQNRDLLEGRQAMSLGKIARAIVARAMGWLYPYGHLGPGQGRSYARIDSSPGVKERYPSPVRRGRLSIMRMSCSIIIVSFAICAAVLRRVGFGRWVRRP